MNSKEIIEELKILDTASLSDALDSLGFNGGLEGLEARTNNNNICGIAFTVKYDVADEEFKKKRKAADFIDDVQDDHIIVLANNGRSDCTVWGGILTKIAKSKNIKGTIIDGACRDIKEIRQLNYPIFTKSIFMQSGKGRAKKINQQVSVYINKVRINPNDFIKGDANGIIVIPNNISEEVIRRAKRIKLTEEKILNAVLNGEKLSIDRKNFSYNEPWK